MDLGGSGIELLLFFRLREKETKQVKQIYSRTKISLKKKYFGGAGYHYEPIVLGKNNEAI